MARGRGRTAVRAGIAAVAVLLLPGAASAAPPANDDFAAARVVGPALPVAVPATNRDATAQPGEPAIYTNPVSRSVWFRWTAPSAAPVFVDVCPGLTGSPTAFTMVAVHTGGAFPLTPVEETAGTCKLSFTPVAGQEYKIQVDFGEEGDFTFRIRQPSPPANDDIASATALGSALPVLQPATTTDSTWQAGEPAALGGSGQARSVWFRWTSPVTGQVQVGACPFQTVQSAANKALVVLTSGTMPLPAPIAQTTNCNLLLSAVAGTQYWFGFSGTVRGEGPFTFSIVDATPPSNDSLAGARLIGPDLPIAVPGDNSFAGIEPGENVLNHGGASGAQGSLWYRWTAPATQRVRVNACSRRAALRMSVYTGTGAGFGTLTPVGDLPPYAPHCDIRLDAVAGTQYWIAVAGGSLDNGRGPFVLDVHAVSPPANDDFAAAQPIGPGLPASASGSNVDATVETGEPEQFEDDYYEAEATVWYRWESRHTGPVTVRSCGDAFPEMVSVYSGSALGSLTRHNPYEGPQECASGVGSTVTFTAQAGTSYRFQVGTVSRSIEGGFTLELFDPNAPPKTVPPIVEPIVGGPIAEARRPGFDLKRAIKSCKKRFKGKSKKTRVKRARCVRRAKLKASLIRCRAIEAKGARTRCLKRARKKFAPRKRPSV